jgi:hypothetical protein
LCRNLGTRRLQRADLANDPLAAIVLLNQPCTLEAARTQARCLN